MSEVESDLWWYKILHNRVIKILDERKNKSLHILDVGCGTGGLMLKLMENGYQNLEGVDYSIHAIDICQKKKLNVSKLSILEIDQQFEPKTFDVVICNDLFCYFSLDQLKEISEKINKILKPNGQLLINTASFEIFRGNHDHILKIESRWHLADIKKAFETNFKIDKSFYWPFLLFPIILVVRVTQTFIRKIFNIHSNHSDLKNSISLLNPFFYTITSFEEKFVNPRFFGSSLFALMTKIN